MASSACGSSSLMYFLVVSRAGCNVPSAPGSVIYKATDVSIVQFCKMKILDSCAVYRNF